MPNDDWRFKGFQNELGSNPTAPRGITATSRASIPNPSGTNWNSTFAQNAPSSPSGTDWKKAFGDQPTLGGGAPSQLASGGGAPAAAPAFNFSISGQGDGKGLSVGGDVSSSSTPVSPTDFYKDRLANSDLTKRDHDLYGAGQNYGFGY